MSIPTKDQIGREVLIPKTLNRIISVVPSQTETILELTEASNVIGRTKFCIHPEALIKNIAKVGGTKNLNLDLIRSLNPQLIIANKEENDKDQILALAESIPVWISDIKNPRDGIEMIQALGELLNQSSRATKLIESIEKERYLFEKESFESLNAAYLIWKDPYMSVGMDTFIHSMMKSAGLKNAFHAQTRYPECTIDQLKGMDLDVILLSSEPFPFKEKHITELARYIPKAKIILVDGELFSWYGSKMILAYKYFGQLRKELSAMSI